MEKFAHESLKLGITPTFFNMLYGEMRWVKNEFDDWCYEFCPNDYERFSLAAREEVIKTTCAAITHWDYHNLDKQNHQNSPQTPETALCEQIKILINHMSTSGKLSDLQELRLWMRSGVDKDFMVFYVKDHLNYLANNKDIRLFLYVLETFPLKLKPEEQKSYLTILEKGCNSNKLTNEEYQKCKQMINIRSVNVHF